MEFLTEPQRRVFAEGVSLVLSRWDALQMAVEKEWGGVDSRKKSQQLESTVLSWFFHLKVCHRDIDDLEHLLDENMMLSFNTEIDNGTIEEVAEQMIIMHEACLHGN